MTSKIAHPALLCGRVCVLLFQPIKQTYTWCWLFNTTELNILWSSSASLQRQQTSARSDANWTNRVPICTDADRSIRNTQRNDQRNAADRLQHLIGVWQYHSECQNQYLRVFLMCLYQRQHKHTRRWLLYFGYFWVLHNRICGNSNLRDSRTGFRIVFCSTCTQNAQHEIFTRTHRTMISRTPILCCEFAEILQNTQLPSRYYVIWFVCLIWNDSYAQSNYVNSKFNVLGTYCFRFVYFELTHSILVSQIGDDKNKMFVLCPVFSRKHDTRQMSWRHAPAIVWSLNVLVLTINMIEP